MDGDTRRSWHLIEMVSLDGCPGFKGPDPQPVSMSDTKSRGSTFVRSRNGELSLPQLSRCAAVSHDISCAYPLGACPVRSNALTY
jgi:hypothetical protein